MTRDASPTPAPALPAPRRNWTLPTLRELPKLTALTLASAIGGGGGTGGGGSTVFALLLAVGFLWGCAASDPMAPADHHTPVVAAPVTCMADVASHSVTCGGPNLSSTEILGGQGTLVALRSTNVSYDGSAIFKADVTVQNLASQTLGAPGGGIDVFFVSGPTVTSGTGTVTLNNPSGTNTFTAAGQDYFNYPDSVQAGASSSALTWKWNVPASVNSFAFTVEVSTQVEDVGGVLQWTTVPQFSSDSFTGIAVNSSTDAMAVGIHGAVMRKVGSEWQRMPVQLNEDWVGVSAIGNGKYVGATQQGSVAIFDGKVWKVLSNRGYAIHGVTAYAANRIAVGGANTLEWYGDNGWFTNGFGGSADFTYFVSYTTNEGFGLSTDGDRCVFNFNSPTPSCGGSAPATAAYGWLDRGQGEALESGNQGYIFDFGASFLASGVNDTTYTALELGSGGPYLWAAAMSNTTGLSHLDSWTAGVWSERAQLDHQVIRMVQDSAGGLYLLSADGIRHWNGSSVVDELVAPQTTYPTAIGGGAGFAFVGMDNGDIHRFDGTAWTTGHPLSFGHVTTVLGFGATAAAALDTTGRFAIYDGTTWNYKGTFSNSYRIWGVDTTHLVMLTFFPPNTPIVRHGDLLAPTADFHPNGLTTPLNAIWGTSDTDFWVVGNGGAVLYYNGSSYTANAPGTALDLRAITGTSNSDLWVAGTSGYIAHWDGGTWTTCSIGSSTITTLFSPRAGVVYVGTGATTDTLTAASCGARAINIPGAFEPVTGLSGASAEDLWAIVGTRVYRGHR